MRENANVVASGEMVSGSGWSYLIAERGHFVATGASFPPGAGARLPSGSVLTLVVSAATGRVTDLGIGKRYPDLRKLGPVSTDLRQTVVPDVTGLGLTAAYARLHRAWLRVSFPALYEGTGGLLGCDPTIAAQDPAAGTVTAGDRTVALTAGPRRCGLGSPGVPTGRLPSAVVPDFVGKPLTTAVSWAETHELYWDAAKLPPLVAARAPTLLANYRVTEQTPRAGATLRLGIDTHNGNEDTFRPTPLKLKTSTVRSSTARASRSTTLAGNEAAAKADAAKLLSEVALPSGARRLGAEPSGDHGYLKPLAHLVTTTIGFVHTRWWRVTGATPGQVIAAVRASPPRDRASTSPSGVSGTGSSATGVIFYLKDVPGVLDSRMIEVTATALPDGATGVLAQSQSIWVVPRTAASMIPATTRVVSVSETTTGGRVLHSGTVTGASRVRAALHYFNGLRPTQPFVYNCPAAIHEPDVVTVKFLSSKRGAPLATASFTGNVSQRGSGGTTPCNPVELRIGAKAPVGLLSDDYISSLNHLLGTHIA
jgi:hypothetical protein